MLNEKGGKASRCLEMQVTELGSQDEFVSDVWDTLAWSADESLIPDKKTFIITDTVLPRNYK